MTQEPLTIRHYLAVLNRRKWLVLPVVVLVPLIVLLVTLSESKVYKSSADVLLNRQNLAANLSGVPDTTSLQDPQRFGQTQAELARVPVIAARTLEAAGVTGESPSSLLGSSSVSPHPNADLLTFSVSASSPELAERLATAYAAQFVRYRADLDSGYLIKARNDAQQRLTQLRDHGQSKSPLATSLLDRISKIGTLLALESPTATLVRVASSAEQTAPRPARNGLLALAAALVIGVALAFFAEAIDTRVSGPDEITEGLGLPLLATIPPPQTRRGGASGLLVVPGASDPQAEAFKMLRTRLELGNLDQTVRSIMLTSASAGEGKTTTAVNLALALGAGGSRVVLCDLDVRNPELASVFGLEGTPGVVDVALGKAELDKALIPVTIPTEYDSGSEYAPSNGGRANSRRQIRILPFGSVAADGGEVLRTEAVAEILARLRERADFVLVDAPPVPQVADALALSTRVDAVIVVARVSVLRRPMLKELGRLLDTTGTRKLGVVVTGAQPSARPYRRGQHLQVPAGFRDGAATVRSQAASLRDQARAWVARQRA